jgi:hypothetical protein
VRDHKGMAKGLIVEYHDGSFETIHEVNEYQSNEAWLWVLIKGCKYSFNLSHIRCVKEIFDDDE